MRSTRNSIINHPPPNPVRLVGSTGDAGRLLKRKLKSIENPPATLAWLVLAGTDDQEAGISAFVRIITRPIWQITQEGTAKSVNWVDHTPKPRFAIYDAGTPGDETDDVVLDKETGLVWERAPSSEEMNWIYAIVFYSYNKYLGGRKGWRLPTVADYIEPKIGVVC